MSPAAVHFLQSWGDSSWTGGNWPPLLLHSGHPRVGRALFPAVTPEPSAVPRRRGSTREACLRPVFPATLCLMSAGFSEPRSTHCNTTRMVWVRLLPRPVGGKRPRPEELTLRTGSPYDSACSIHPGKLSLGAGEQRVRASRLQTAGLAAVKQNRLPAALIQVSLEKIMQQRRRTH